MPLSIPLALLGTIGFCILFQVPRRCIAFSAMLGALGWAVYSLCLSCDLSVFVAAFAAASTVAIFGEMFSRIKKEAATVFVIPGILPLVPGMGIYYFMFYFITGDESQMAYWGEQTLMIAGSIAVGLLVVSSIVRIINNLTYGTHTEKN